MKVLKASYRWWVYVTPQRSLKAMQEKLQIIKNYGFVSEPVTTPGRMKYSISLAYFAQEDTARSFIDRLKKEGVTSVVLTRKSASLDQIVIDIPKTVKSTPPYFFSLNEKFPHHEIREIPCLKETL